MRRGVIVCAAAIAIGLLATTAVYFWKSERSSSTSWLRSQFALDDQQASSVERIHRDYQAECALMCARIAETDAQLAKLICDGQQVTPEIQSAIIETDRRSNTFTGLLPSFRRRDEQNISGWWFFLWCCARERWRNRTLSSPLARREQIEYHLFCREPLWVRGWASGRF